MAGDTTAQYMPHSHIIPYGPDASKYALSSASHNPWFLHKCNNISLTFDTGLLITGSTVVQCCPRVNYRIYCVCEATITSAHNNVVMHSSYFWAHTRTNITFTSAHSFFFFLKSDNASFRLKKKIHTHNYDVFFFLFFFLTCAKIWNLLLLQVHPKVDMSLLSDQQHKVAPSMLDSSLVNNT